MLLTSLLDRFPLMARMALRWPLLAREVPSVQQVTNAPAHTLPALQPPGLSHSALSSSRRSPPTELRQHGRLAPEGTPAPATSGL